MTNKIKIIFLIIGLAVCILIVFITKAEASEDTNTENKIDHAGITQSVCKHRSSMDHSNHL